MPQNATTHSSVRPKDGNQPLLFSFEELSASGMDATRLTKLYAQHLSEIQFSAPTRDEILSAWDNHSWLHAANDTHTPNTLEDPSRHPYLMDTPFAKIVADLQIPLTYRRFTTEPPPYPSWLANRTAHKIPGSVVNHTAAREGELEDLYRDLLMRFMTSEGQLLLQERFGKQGDAPFLRAMQHNISILLKEPEALNAIRTVLGVWVTCGCDEFMSSAHLPNSIPQSSRLLSSVAETLDVLAERLGLVVPPAYQKPLDFSNLDRLLALYRTLQGLTQPNAYGEGGATGSEMPALHLSDFYNNGKLLESRKVTGSNLPNAWSSIYIQFSDRNGVELDLRLPVSACETSDFFRRFNQNTPNFSGDRRARTEEFSAANADFTTAQENFRQLLLAVVEHNLSKIANRPDVDGLIERIGQRVAYFDYLAAFVCTSVESVTARQSNFCLARPFDDHEDPVSSIVARNLTRPVVPSDSQNTIEVPNDTVFSANGTHENVRIVAAPNSGGKSYFFVGTITQSRVVAGLAGIAYATEYGYHPDGRVAMPVAVYDITTRGGGFVNSVTNLQTSFRALKPTNHDFLVADEIEAGLANEGGEKEVALSLFQEVVARRLHLYYLGHNRAIIQSVQKVPIQGVVVVHAPLKFSEQGIPSPSYMFSLSTPNWENHKRNVVYLLQQHKQTSWLPSRSTPPLASFNTPFPAPVIIASCDTILKTWRDKALVRDPNDTFSTFSEAVEFNAKPFNQLQLPLTSANTPSFKKLMDILEPQKLTLACCSCKQNTSSSSSQAGAVTGRVIDDNAARVGEITTLLEYYRKLCISREGSEYIADRFEKQLPPEEIAQVHGNLDRFIKNPEALQSLDLILRIWEQLDCQSLFHLGSEGDLATLHEKVYAIQALMDVLEEITNVLQLDLPDELRSTINFSEYSKLLHLISVIQLMAPDSEMYGSGGSRRRLPDSSADHFRLPASIDNQQPVQEPRHFGEVVNTITFCVELHGGRKYTLHLPTDFQQLQTFFGHPQTQGSDSSVRTWTSWIEPETRINYALDHQYQLVLDTLRFNLAGISGHPAVTEIFKIVSARIAYFDYLGALANKAVHAVTARKTPICAPSMHSVATGSGKPSIVAQAACPPYKSRCVAGKEVPNDLYGEQRIQISTGPCSGGKTYTYITTNIMNRVAAALGDLICAESYSFDPGGRTLFPVIPGDVKKQGSAFIATIKATKDALNRLAPNRHDQLLFDEFGGGVSDEGGEFEVAQDVLTELSNDGLTVTYITHNELLAAHFKELGLPSSKLLHAGIVLGPHGPTLTYQQEIGSPNPALYKLHLRRLIDHHKPGLWIEDGPPPGIE